MWDKRQKKMAYEDEVCVVMTQGKLFSVNEFFKGSRDHMVFMLWTGLKDSDDNKIYAEDFLEVKAEKAVQVGQVIFDKGAFRFRYLSTGTIVHLDEIMEKFPVYIKSNGYESAHFFKDYAKKKK